MSIDCGWSSHQQPGAAPTLDHNFARAAGMTLVPIGIDVLEDLVHSRDLDPGVIDRVPTFTLHGASVEWRPHLPERVAPASRSPRARKRRV